LVCGGNGLCEQAAPGFDAALSGTQGSASAPVYRCIEIERFPGKVKVIVHTAKPGILIGRKGENVKKIRQSLEAEVGKKIDLEIKEIKSPDLDAYLVAHNIADQLERRISYQRAMKRAIQQAMRQGGRESVWRSPDA
jgi:ribosomal protein S3